MEDIKNGLTVETADWADPVTVDSGETDVTEAVLREAWVAAMVEDCKILMRLLKVTTCDVMTLAGKAASTRAAVAMVYVPTK